MGFVCTHLSRASKFSNSRVLLLSESERGSTMSDYLPEEVLTDIFTRLPIKTLLQIRCACKSWYALITSPNFIQHVNRTLAHNTPPLLLLRYCIDNKEHYTVHCDDETFVQCRPLDSAFDHSPISYFRILGSCNGLICLYDSDGPTEIIILWNPAIDKSVTLRIESNSKGCAFGFGFDSRTNDYKVVRLVYVHDSSFDYSVRPEVDVYELSTGIWRRWRRGIGSAPPPPCHIILCQWSHVFVNGASHWIALNGSVGLWNKIWYLILSFDMGTEVFTEMMLPSGIANGCELKVSIALFGESLSLFCYDDGFSSTSIHCCIWVMKEYGVASSWTKLCTVDIGGICQVLGFRKTGEVLVEKRNGRLVSYDPETKEVVDTGIRGHRSSFHLYTYVESMVLLGRKK
ncbi:F-box protein CPR1-like [Cornus florida]|uniref:F-box protein CPR1-like n=1 Tax=Cornus florida TaxID=4283 RepID=UPI00289B9FED|nr:F-box protein CPR1-like [Cornus florida]XP_059665492.1 F-box protein CPR1-like [Cornus florida]XP_059665493.1 F-box protein CPR1-like [Cornus florida]